MQPCARSPCAAGLATSAHAGRRVQGVTGGGSMAEAGGILPAARAGEHGKTQTAEGCCSFMSVASQNNHVSHQFSILRNLGNMRVPTAAEGPAQGERYQVPSELSPVS